MKKILITALALSLGGAFTLTAGDDARKDDKRKHASRDNDRHSEDVRSWADDRGDEVAAAADDTGDAMRDAGRDARDSMRDAGEDASTALGAAAQGTRDAFRSAGESLRALSTDSIRVVSRDDIDARDSIDDILGADVVDTSEDQIGSVSDVAFQEGQIRDVFVQVGGILGFGGQLVRIPYESLDKVERDDKKMYQLGVTSDEFSNAIDNNRGVELENGARAEVADDASLEGQVTADRLEGTAVVDSQGERIGSIARIAFDHNNELGAYLEVDGIDGLDDHYVEIPLASLQRHHSEDEEVYRVNLSSDEFMQTVRQSVPQRQDLEQPAASTDRNTGTAAGA